MTRWHPLAPVIVAVGLVSSTASGQPADRAAAREHYARADQHYRQGDFARALAEYKRALALRKDPAFVFNIAQCHRQLGQDQEALFYYRLYLVEAKDAPNRREVRQTIEDLERRLAERRLRLGRLSVVTEPAAATLRLNRPDAPVAGRSPAMLELEAGDYLVICEASGHAPGSRRVTVVAGRTTEVALKLSPFPRVAPPGPRTTGAGSAPPPGRLGGAPLIRRWWFWAGVATSLALVAGSVATGVLTAERSREWQDHGIARDRQVGIRLRTATDLQWSLAAATAIAVTIGSLVYIRRRPRERQTWVSPACTTQGCALWVTGRF
jgi:hypothetical protein